MVVLDFVDIDHATAPFEMWIGSHHPAARSFSTHSSFDNDASQSDAQQNGKDDEDDEDENDGDLTSPFQNIGGSGGGGGGGGGGGLFGHNSGRNVDAHNNDDDYGGGRSELQGGMQAIVRSSNNHRSLLMGPAGSVTIYDSRILHRQRSNASPHARTSLTITVAWDARAGIRLSPAPPPHSRGDDGDTRTTRGGSSSGGSSGDRADRGSASSTLPATVSTVADLIAGGGFRRERRGTGEVRPPSTEGVAQRSPRSGAPRSSPAPARRGLQSVPRVCSSLLPKMPPLGQIAACVESSETWLRTTSAAWKRERAWPSSKGI